MGRASTPPDGTVLQQTRYGKAVVSPLRQGTDDARAALLNRVAATAAICVFLLMGPDLLMIAVGENRSLVRAVMAACSLGIVAVAVVFRRTLVSAARVEPFLAALVALVCASVLWSVNGGNTTARLPTFLTCTLLGMMTGRMLSLRSLVYLLASLGTLVALLSLAAVAVFPDARGLPPWDNTWRGVFGHKNGLGAACAFALPFTIYAAVVAEGLRRRFYALGTIGLLVLLFASESRTAQLITGIALLNLGIAMAFRQLQFSWSTITAIVFAATLLSMPLIISSGLAQTLFDIMGREPTLSGRLPLWKVVWPWIEQRPVLGYGYAAFWEPDSYRIRQITGHPSAQWEVYYSHNGALETLLDVGVVGLSLLLAAYARAFWAILCLLRRCPYAHDLAPIMIFLISFLLANITEASALQREDIIWIIFVAVVVRLQTLQSAGQANRLRLQPGYPPERPALLRHHADSAHPDANVR